MRGPFPADVNSVVFIFISGRYIVMAIWNWGRKRESRMSAAENITDADGVSRRDFLRAGGLTVVGLSGAARAASLVANSNRRAILILMTGGVSQL